MTDQPKPKTIPPMSQPNQSFTEFKEKKRAAEQQIQKILNDFSEEFKVRIRGVDHDTLYSMSGDHMVISVRIDAEI